MTKYFLIGAVLAILLALIGGFWYGTKHADSSLQTQISSLNTLVANYRTQIADDKATYDANLNTWKSKEADLLVQYNNLLAQNQQVITKVVTHTVVKEVDENPKEYQCVVPSAGMNAIFEQAIQLNSVRGD